MGSLGVEGLTEGSEGAAGSVVLVVDVSVVFEEGVSVVFDIAGSVVFAVVVF